MAREQLRVVHADEPGGDAGAALGANHQADSPQLDVGAKYDAGKPRLDLLPWNAVLACAQVLTHGAAKYGENNWYRVPSGRRRYLAAALRHVVAFARGEWLDAESGLPHLAHAITSLMFLFELAQKEGAE